jgi:superfamily I DNA/RNA helicase
VTVSAVEGPAGTGKTWRITGLLCERMDELPLASYQSVLGLTFMHGARRRLQERLSKVAPLRGRFSCVTIDSFAWHLRMRWRSLQKELKLLDPAPDDYDGQCGVAAALLEQPLVAKWVAASHPIILVDEAQDLRPERLRIIQALDPVAGLLLAADEFQCLDSQLRKNPLIEWLPTVCDPERLSVVRRTTIPGLLVAAHSIRSGGSPQAGKGLRISSVATAPMAAAYLANAIAWGGGGTIAIITPSMSGSFVKEAVERVRTQACGSQKNGPYNIRWERSDLEEAGQANAAMDAPESCTFEGAIKVIERIANVGILRRSKARLAHEAHTMGKVKFSRAELEAIVRRSFEVRAVYSKESAGLLAMTIQQAKNREFEGVVVVWPYQVGGDEEQKRRLLYNAITRATRWCAILIQGKSIPTSAPFG